MNPKYLPGSIISSIIFLEVLSVSVAGSSKPWAILFHGHIVLRIVGWYLAVQLVGSVLAWLFFKVVSDDEVGHICWKNLKAFIPVYGPPEMCYRCRTWYHKNCYAARKKRCPICYPETLEGPEVPLDFTSEFPRY